MIYIISEDFNEDSFRYNPDLDVGYYSLEHLAVRHGLTKNQLIELYFIEYNIKDGQPIYLATQRIF